MADRTVRVKLSGNSRDLESALERAGRKADTTNAKLEALDNKELSAKYDLDTKDAERKARQARVEGERFDKSHFTAKYSAEVDDTVRRTQEEMEKIGRTRTRSGMVEDIRQAKKEFADLKRQMAGHTPKLDLDIREAQRKRDQLKRSLKALEDGKTDPRIDLNIKKAEAKRNDLRRKLKELSSERATPQISANIKRFEADLGLVELQLKELRASRNKPAIEADIAALRRDVERADELLNRLRDKRVSPKVGARIEELERKIAESESALKSFDAETYQAKLDAQEAALQRKLDKVLAKAEEVERKRQMKLDAATKPAERKLITLNEVANRATRFREMRIGVNSNAATEMLSLEAIAQSLEQTRKIKIDESELRQARVELFQFNIAAENATRDRQFKVLGEFGQAKVDASTLDQTLNRLSRDRRVRLNSDFGAIRAEAADINRALDEAGQDRVARLALMDRGIGARIQELQRQLDQYGRTNAVATVGLKGGQNVNRRMQTIMGAVMAFAPAVTASASAAGASMVSLSTILMGGVAVAGAGFAAFKGLGDSIKAAGAHAMNPTAKTAEALDKALVGADKTTKDFVKTLGGFAPTLKNLQSIARTNMFPGLTQGLNAATAALPELARLTEMSSQALGRLGKNAGESLGSPFWRQYFDFLTNRGVPAFEKFMTAIGNITKGIAGLQMAVQPFTDDFVNGFDRMAKSFSDWSETLDSNKEFQDWLQYVREIGPQVMEALRAIAEAGGAIGVAMRPVAPVVLELITHLAKLVETVMESDIGPPIMAMVTALGLLRMGGLLLKGSGLLPLLRGIGAAATTMRAGSGAAAALGASYAAMAGGAGRAASGTAAAGTAAATATGKWAKLGSGLKTAVGALPVVGAVALGVVAGMDAMGTSTDEAATKLLKGGKAADEMRAQLARTDENLRGTDITFGNLGNKLTATALHMLGFESSTAEANAEVARMRAEMGELGWANAEVDQAQVKLNEAIAQFGATSPQAAAAANHLANQQKNVALQSQLVNKTGQGYLNTVSKIAQGNDGASEAARHLAAGFSAADLAAMGAKIRIDATGKAVATLPNKKTIDLRADANNALFQLGAVSTQLKGIPPGKTVNVGVIGGPAQDTLRKLGFEVKQIPGSKEVNVTAKTADAKAQLGILTKFAEAVRLNPKISSDPQLAYDTLLKFVNDANAANGKPGLKPRTPEANTAVQQLVEGWNLMEGTPKVNPDTTNAVAKSAAWHAYTQGLIPTPTINANAVPAANQAFQWNNDTARLEPVPRVNANTGPAWGESFTWNANTGRLEPVPRVNANPADAHNKTRNWNAEAAGMHPVPRVDADTSGATNSLWSLWNSWNGKIVRWIVNTVGGKAGGGPVGPAMADGGPVPRAARGMHVRTTRTLSTGRLAGPGSGTSDSIPIMAANGEWVIRRRIAAIQGQARMALLNAGLADIVPHAEKLRNAAANMPMKVHVPTRVQSGGSSGGGTVINNYFTINNPRAERSSDDIQKAGRKMANSGMFSDG